MNIWCPATLPEICLSWVVCLMQPEFVARQHRVVQRWSRGDDPAQGGEVGALAQAGWRTGIIPTRLDLLGCSAYIVVA
jgi:hypothetical protein